MIQMYECMVNVWLNIMHGYPLVMNPYPAPHHAKRSAPATNKAASTVQLCLLDKTAAVKVPLEVALGNTV